MSKLEKLLAKIRNNPKAVAFDDLDHLLQHCGFIRRQPGSGSSHYVYTHGSSRITVPRNRPYLKAVYVKQALALLEQVLEDER